MSKKCFSDRIKEKNENVPVVKPFRDPEKTQDHNDRK